MKIQIKSWVDSSVAFEADVDNIKSVVELAVKNYISLYGADLRGALLYGADLREADLREANLREANLREADLRGADLYGACLYGACLYGEKIKRTPIQLIGLKWWICITEKHIQIGCQINRAEEWFKFSDDQISEMHDNALEWWKKNKMLIKMLWEHHCEVP